LRILRFSTLSSNNCRILLLILSGIVVVSGLSSVDQTEYACGWDGYYYLVQVQSLNNTGIMHSPEYSLVYVPLLAFHAITGDYVVSYRMSTVFIKLLFVLSVFTITLSLLKSSGCYRRKKILYTALLTAAASAMSPSMNYFFAQFPKNLLGFALFFFFMASVFSSSRYRNSDVYSKGGWFLRISGSLLLFLAAFFTHRFSAILLLFFLVLYSAPRVMTLLKQLWSGSGRKQGRLILLIGSAFLILVLLISSRLPLAPSIHDLERITGDLSSNPIFVPSSFINTFGLFRLTPAWRVEIYAAAALLLLTGVLLLVRNRFIFMRIGREYYILIILSLIGLFPFIRFSLTGLSYRLFFGTMLMLPLVCIPYLKLVVDKLLQLHLFKGKLKTETFPVLVFLAMLALSLYTDGSYISETHDPPYSLYEELAGEVAGALSNIDFELIIAHKALAEMITFKYEIDALPWAPEDYYESDRVWRITAGILRDEVAYYLSPERAEQYFIRLSGDYGLLREDQWNDFIDCISDDPVMMEAVNTWRNPHEQRPLYLVKNR